MNIATECLHERLLPRDRFEAELVAAVEEYRPEETRFFRAVGSGRCPPSLLQRYACSTYWSAKLFAASLAEMIEKAPDRDARLTLLENLLEEEGMHLRSDTGIVVRPEQRHPALALRFLRACGGHEAQAAEVGRHAVGPGRQMLAEGRWLEAVSFLLIGQELKFATASQALFRLLSGAGYAERDLAFFAVHGIADCAHGREALDLVLDRAVTARQQEECILAASAGARHWFEMHGGAARPPAG